MVRIHKYLNKVRVHVYPKPSSCSRKAAGVAQALEAIVPALSSTAPQPRAATLMLSTIATYFISGPQSRSTISMEIPLLSSVTLGISKIITTKLNGDIKLIEGRYYSKHIVEGEYCQNKGSLFMEVKAE